MQLALELYPEDLPRVRTPREHGELLHAGGSGTVAISNKAERRWNQAVYPVEVALALLDQYRGSSHDSGKIVRQGRSIPFVWDCHPG